MLSFRVICAIQLLRELELAASRGERLLVGELRTRCGLQGLEVSHVLLRLRQQGWVDQIGNRNFMAKDLNVCTLYDLVVAMDGGLHLGSEPTFELWSFNNRDHYQRAIDLDMELTAEMEQRLREIMISDLIPCNKPIVRQITVRKKVTATQQIGGGSQKV